MFEIKSGMDRSINCSPNGAALFVLLRDAVLIDPIKQSLQRLDELVKESVPCQLVSHPIFLPIPVYMATIKKK